MSIMIPTIPSYLNKEFIIDDNQALVRNPNNLAQSSRFKVGDTLPPNFSVGDKKLIPLNTSVKVTNVRMDTKRNVFIFAVPVGNSNFIPSGWTRVTNLDGKFSNEIVSYFPNNWELEPTGNNYTVTDNKSLIRNGGPNYNSIGEVIPIGSYVEVTARSRETVPEGKYVRLRHLTIQNGAMVLGEPIGWTAASNLVAGNSLEYKKAKWVDKKGDNAAWRLGEFIGAKLLVGVVGTGGQLQKIDFAIAPHYLRLIVAAKKENLVINIRSGFRTFAKQNALFQLHLNGLGNLAAKPGRSNHQNGIAFDLNTGGFDGAPVYDWMKKNGTSFGFLRTVNKEHWHWEYNPRKAEELRSQGKFKLARVKI